MRNVENDVKHTKELKKQGWRVFVIWECEIKKQFEKTMQNLVKAITGD